MTAPDLLDQRRLALVHGKLADGNGRVGTGCLVCADLLLTASHVVPDQGLAALKLMTISDGRWRSAQAVAVWRDVGLDAVLVRLDEPVAGLDDVPWVTDPIQDNLPWQSCGFPVAGLTERDDKPQWTSVGLEGTLYGLGGISEAGQELHAGVADEAIATQWKGVSGAPVFVQGRLAGIITKVLPGFDGKRFGGPLGLSLLGDTGFRLALADPGLAALAQAGERWLLPNALPQQPWVLVVRSEASRIDLAEVVANALKKDGNKILAAVGASSTPQAIAVRIQDAVQSPGHWQKFVQTLCAAPLAIFDATDTEPAVMLALGVRAVVRRGVTITSTAHKLTPELLSALPFNIQETKLVHHGKAYKPDDPRHPLTMIPAAIKMGWLELKKQPRYLDLPAYDGVRCPYPASYAEGPDAADRKLLTDAVNRILVLCPFHQDFEPNWLALANALSDHHPERPAVRMLDVASPRLVGQALYEGIRWAQTCVVDWTRWRPNVFFELGVRLACADTGPVCLIDAAGLDDAAIPPLQKRSLLALWPVQAYQPPPDRPAHPDEPTRHRLDAIDAQNEQAFEAAFNAHAANVARKPLPAAAGALPHDATYRTCTQSFDWSQEGITAAPHEVLQRSVQDPFGDDPQAAGRQPILYSTNPAYGVALGRNVRERWIAAWYYLYNRYPESQWENDSVLRGSLRALANNVLQFGPAKDDSDPHTQKLRTDLAKVLLRLKKLEKLDKAQPPGAP